MPSRSGLGRTGGRLRVGEPLTVAFIGGSVTNGAAASSEAASYRRLVASWLAAQHPSGDVREINAALGGTGSVWGAFRAHREVLVHDPHLVFVEFAVNDGPPEGRTLRAMEGLLRQILESKRQEVCLLYAGCRDDVELVAGGRPRPPVSWHERLAEHYGIPSIEMALPLVTDVAVGRCAWDVHFVDHVHPTDAGMARYADAVTAALPGLLSAAVDDRPVPPSLTADPWDAPTIVDAENVEIDGTGWSLEHVDAAFSTYRFGTVLGARTPGAELKLRVSGSVVGILHGLGPDTGQLFCSIDGGPARDLDLWDEFAPQVTRPQVAVLAEDLEPGVHEISLRVGADRHPDSVGDVARICAVLSHDPGQRR